MASASPAPGLGPRAENGKITGCTGAKDAIAFGASGDDSKDVTEWLMQSTDWIDRPPQRLGHTTANTRCKIDDKADKEGWNEEKYIRPGEEHSQHWFGRDKGVEGRRVIIGHEKGMKALERELLGRTVVFPALRSGSIGFGPKEEDKELLMGSLVFVKGIRCVKKADSRAVETIPLAGRLLNDGKTHGGPEAGCVILQHAQDSVDSKVVSVEALLLEQSEAYLCIILDNGIALRFRGSRREVPCDVWVTTHMM